MYIVLMTEDMRVPDEFWCQNTKDVVIKALVHHLPVLNSDVLIKNEVTAQRKTSKAGNRRLVVSRGQRHAMRCQR